MLAVQSVAINMEKFSTMQKKGKIQGDVPPEVAALYSEWKGKLRNAKQQGLLLAACVVVAAQHADERDDMFAELVKADATGSVAELIEESLAPKRSGFAGRRAAHPKPARKGAKKSEDT